MALPIAFKTAKEYFEAFKLFLDDNQYLFKETNTNVLVNKLLDQICVENVNNIHKDKNIFEKNNYLLNMNERIKKFEVKYEKSLEIEEIKFNEPLSLKKKHEIIYLAEEIKALCDSLNCSTVVDFGSGLGYLDQHLFKITNYSILGIECNEHFHNEAKKRQQKYHKNSVDKVKYVKQRINAESKEDIEKYLEEFAPKSSFCITGLHACADLTVDALDLFLKMADCKAMVLLSCCYHKMQNNDGIFNNFPVSQTCKKIFAGSAYVNIPFLRLAAQPPDSRCDLKSSVFNLLARATLQCFAHRHGCILKRKKRKAVRMKTINNDFESYLQDACTNGFSISKQDTGQTYAFDLDEIRTLWMELDIDTFNRAAIFVLLQNKLQPILENFILYDRLIYLYEKGVNNCKYKIIFNTELSPRCLAFIVCK